MKGYRQIESLRLQGARPVAVFVTIGHCPAAEFPFDESEAAIANGGLPEVWTDGTDPELADLRFLRVCRVHLELRDGPRCAFGQWWDAIQAVGPSAIVGVDPEGEVVAWRA